MDRYNELVDLLKIKKIKVIEVDIFDDQPNYWLEVSYYDKKGNRKSKYSQEYKTIEAASVELLEYFKREF